MDWSADAPQFLESLDVLAQILSDGASVGFSSSHVSVGELTSLVLVLVATFCSISPAHGVMVMAYHSHCSPSPSVSLCSLHVSCPVRLLVWSTLATTPHPVAVANYLCGVAHLQSCVYGRAFSGRLSTMVQNGPRSPVPASIFGTLFQRPPFLLSLGFAPCRFRRLSRLASIFCHSVVLSQSRHPSDHGPRPPWHPCLATNHFSSAQRNPGVLLGGAMILPQLDDLPFIRTDLWHALCASTMTVLSSTISQCVHVTLILCRRSRPDEVDWTSFRRPVSKSLIIFLMFLCSTETVDRGPRTKFQNFTSRNQGENTRPTNI